MGFMAETMGTRILGFLTLGIALGSWWAYYELGWGGWWFWDPVENTLYAMANGDSTSPFSNCYRRKGNL